MRARIPIVTKSQERELRKEVRRIYKKQFETDSNAMVRRSIKMIYLALAEEFGFGEKRFKRLDKAVMQQVERTNMDEVYWEHGDRLLIDKYHLNFERDYTERGKPA